MHVGLVIYGDLEETSGGFRYDRKLVSYLQSRGDTVDVISLPWRRYPRAVLDGFSPRVRSKIDRNVDVLLVDGLCHPSVWRHNDRLQGPDAIVGLVHHLRSDDPTERFRHIIRPFERRFLESVDGLVCTSEFSATRVDRIAPRLSSVPRVVAHPAGRVEGKACSEQDVSDRARVEPFRIVFVGNLIPRKDPETVVSALDRFCSSRPAVTVRLTVVGSQDADPSYAASVESHARNLNLDDRVTFTGQTSDEELASILARSHVCCVLSRYEAFGMVHLEAMEYGVVPIASTVGGATEFVVDGENGFLVDPGDFEAIADRLVRLESDRNLLAELATGALETAAEWPEWTETMETVRTVLRQFVDGQPRVRGVPP